MTDLHLTETPASPAAEQAVSRRERILEAAANAFATHGYRGSSLRDIARDAGCSLTLLDHHFGGKSQLLDAVLQQQNLRCERRLQTLRSDVDGAPHVALDDFVARWANDEFDLYATPQGRLYLQLMMRLAMEAELGPQRRRNLDCAQELVMRAFARARPALAEDTRRAGWHLASAALYAAIVRADEALPPANADASAAERRRTIAFLVEGLRGCWREAAGD